MSKLRNYNPRNTVVSLKGFQAKIFNKNKLAIKAGYYKLFWGRIKFKFLFSVLFILFFLLFAFVSSPSDFPIGTIVTIGKGETLSEIAEGLEEKNVIRSSLIFEVLSRLFVGEDGIMAGDYFFEEKNSIFSVIERTTTADYGIDPTRVTIVEGSTIYDIAEILENNFPNFDAGGFLKIAKDEAKEGYLFPDTYYFLPNVTPQSVITTMENNFHEKIKKISDTIEESDKSLKEIVIMASLLEKEARTLETKRIIAGILWKRIDIGMPLQVDAVFPYIVGKNTYEVSLKDLEVESAYNTYTNRGLPIGPIDNPSLWSILAAATPRETDYLFYLSDRRGNMHYGVNFEEHKRNRVLYLN